MTNFLLKIKNGKPSHGSEHNQARFYEFCRNHEGKWLRVELNKNPVSDGVRGYYFGAVLQTVRSVVPEWASLSNDDLHEILKKMFNYFDFFNPITKRTERVGRSAMSDESNTARAMDFVEKIRLWLAEDYLTELPSPDEHKKLLDNAELK